jgi:hypothetical protein
MGTKDNVKSGGVIPFDHKDKEKTNHDKLRGSSLAPGTSGFTPIIDCTSQILTPDLVHVLFSAQIDGAKANWGS